MTYSEIKNITPEFLSMIKLPEKNGKSLNYLIVSPEYEEDNVSNNIVPNFGVLYISAALKASGRMVHTLNLKYKPKAAELLRHMITKRSIDVVLTGGLVGSYKYIKNIIDISKKHKPDIITVVGGGFITSDPIVGMTALENVDYGVIGEGEITVNALAYALETNGDAASIDGVICLRNGKWSVRDKGQIVDNLDILPFPDYIGFDIINSLKKQDKAQGDYIIIQKAFADMIAAFVVISRSCPYNCTFCSRAHGVKYRHMSLETVKKYLEWLLYLYPFDAFIFVDDLIFSDTEYANELCHYMKSLNIKWMAYVRANIATKKVLTTMKNSGCETIFLGIESADNRILKSMNKQLTIEQIENTLDWSVEIGLTVSGGLILGNPEETTESLWRSIEWQQAHTSTLAPISISLIRAFTGSHIYKDACEKGIIEDPVSFLKNGCPPINLSKLTDDEYNILPEIARMFTYKNYCGKSLLDPEVRIIKDGFINIAGRCRHCDNIIAFPYRPLIETSLLSCPICRERVYINAIEYCNHEIMNENAKKIVSDVKAAVWAINLNNFFWLTRAMPVLKADNVYYINTNRVRVPDNGKYINSFFGKEIFPPDKINEEGIDTVIVPNTSSIFNEIKQQCSIAHPCVKRVIHVTEMLKCYEVRC